MHLTKYLLLTFAAWHFATSQCLAAYDIFLQTDPVIQGESQAKNFTGAWELTSFSHGITLPISGVGANRTVGPSKFSDVAIAKFLDKASVHVLLKVANGSPLAKVTISFVSVTGTNPVVFYKVVLENVVISSINQAGDVGMDATRLSESVSFNFSKITWTYTAQNPDGSLAAPITQSWDLSGTKTP